MGIGEHLGYLLTGVWTVLVAVSIVATSAFAPWLGWIGLPIGGALLLGSSEFVGPNEEAGWSLMGAIVPIAYVAWSLWLICARHRPDPLRLSRGGPSPTPKKSG